MINDSQQLRSRGDRELAQQLREEPLLKNAIEQLERGDLEGPQNVRRRLLGTAVRLTRAMAPAVHRLTDECRERLKMDMPLELYVFSSPTFNAAAVKPEDGRLFVMFSSSLLEAFSGHELKFVIGHELGHHLFQHHDIPIGYVLNQRKQVAPSLALKLFAWSRYAEISADRAGAACSQNLEAEALALFKLASGLTGSSIEFRLDDFLDQVEEMRQEDDQQRRTGPREDWFSTHPFSPLRVLALKLFAASHFVTANGTDTATLESETQRVMTLMEPSYLDDQSAEAETLRRLLFAAALTVANASDDISEKEIEVFEGFFGERSFTEQLNLDKLAADLDQRIKDACEQASHPRRLQVLRDLILVANADGVVSEAERIVLKRIASGLQISLSVIDQLLNNPLELD